MSKTGLTVKVVFNKTMYYKFDVILTAHRR